MEGGTGDYRIRDRNVEEGFDRGWDLNTQTVIWKLNKNRSLQNENGIKTGNFKTFDEKGREIKVKTIKWESIVLEF